MSARRVTGAVLAIACAAGLAWLYHHNTDFPTNAPVERVDAAMLEHLRAHPGLHMALSEHATFEVPLDFREDKTNQGFYGTDIDKREAVARRSIHVQRKNGHMAIHCDNWNPTFGVGAQLIHATIDVPAVPMILGLIVGVVLATRRSKRDPASAPP